jgi:PAS domain-containing protein
MSGEQMQELLSILEHSPNGIVVVDKECRIQYVNPAFRSMFFAGEGELTGQKAWKLLRSDCFERAFEADDALSVRGTIPDHDVHYRATLFKLEDSDRCCGIFIDTSEEERARAELTQVRRETLARAQEVIGRQMHTAQEIAGLLGETTADTKVLLTKLTALLREEGTP